MHEHPSPLTLVARSHRCCTNRSQYINCGCTFSRQTSYVFVSLWFSILISHSPSFKDLRPFSPEVRHYGMFMLDALTAGRRQALRCLLWNLHGARTHQRAFWWSHQVITQQTIPSCPQPISIPGKHKNFLLHSQSEFPVHCRQGLKISEVTFAFSPIKCLNPSNLGSDHKFQNFLYHFLGHCIKLDPFNNLSWWAKVPKSTWEL